MNDLPIEFIRETGHGTCADLRGVQLNGEDFDNPHLGNWRLQGALLDGAELSYANLGGAVLWGAQMGDMHLKGATLNGFQNEFTELPQSADCTTQDHQRVSCQ